MNTDFQVEAIRRIELMARRDPTQRGLAPYVDTHDLLPAAVSLLQSERVILVTGFCIRSAMIGETDGPSGALALADALRQMGKEVTLVTDIFSSSLLDAGAGVFGAPYPTLILPPIQDNADREILNLLEFFSPTHVVAIERPGNAADGHRYSMRGECLDDLVPGTDLLLAPGFPHTYQTIAIGDGGNELGLGSLRDQLKGHIPHGDLIFCATAADYVIPSGISNWGAFALVAALSILTKKCLIRPPEHEHAVLSALVAAGAVDGCTKENAISVDGLSWENYALTLADIYEAAWTTLANPEKQLPSPSQR